MKKAHIGSSQKQDSQNSMLRALLAWYHREKRPLPWRQRPQKHLVYKIWISEVMLQQTQVHTILPYYKKFLRHFPHLKSLATSPLEKVLSHWSGLGYYRRARQLHATAQILYERQRQFIETHHRRRGRKSRGKGEEVKEVKEVEYDRELGGAMGLEEGFWPRTYKEWIELPGIGPYTARAISSIAFQEKTGVLDGNVIRVLSRFFRLKVKWWETKGRRLLQERVDELCQSSWPSGDINQALMELGARICQPTQARCSLCPLQGEACKSTPFKKAGPQDVSFLYELPLKRPKKEVEKWLWQVSISSIWKKKYQVALLQNRQSPFLKNAWLPPGRFYKIEEKPQDFQFQHHITHHHIFVQLEKGPKLPKKDQETLVWVKKNKIAEINPSSLVRKVLAFSLAFCFISVFSCFLQAQSKLLSKSKLLSTSTSMSPSSSVWRQSKWGFAIEEKGLLWKRQISKPSLFFPVLLQKGVLALYQSPDGTGQLSLHLHPLSFGAVELKEYLKNWIRDYPLYGFKIKGKRFFRLQKRSAFVLDFFHPPTKKKLRQVTVLVKGSRALVFTCQSPENLFEKQLTHCNQILNSIYWL